MSKAACLMIGLTACAMGGTTQQQQQVADASPNGIHDAAMVTGDSKVFHDAPVSHLDAFVPQDAPLTGAGGLCADNTTCAATLCCYFFVCTAGTPVGDNICLPN
ncbi:MAG TPA: hypothetical protein VF403_24700 [Kofleriaceae bacterium]